LMAAAGPAERAMELMAQIVLPSAAAAEMAWLAEIVGRIRIANPELSLTIDPVENRGFEYHTGVSFTIFARGIRGELGRGGRYLAGGDGRISPLNTKRMAQPPEPAIGFTLYADTVLRAVPDAPAPHRIYLPHGTPRAVGQQLRNEGWVTLDGLAPASAPLDEARRLLCSHTWHDGAPLAL
ncbi:MAG: ATP phosphoribosyltransferase regulatory subunit, partial [Aliidongia sp.]